MRPMRTVPDGQAQFLDEEVATLLLIRALEVAPNPDLVYVWPLLVVPKKGPRKFRLVVNMAKLTPFVYAPSFKLETLDSFLRQLRPGFHIWTDDLADGYHHVLIRPESRNLLGLCHNGIVYRFTVLPFGLRSSPYVFCKLMRLIVAHIRQVVPAALNYIDDFAMAADPDSSTRLRERTHEILSHFGVVISAAKSTTPSTRALVLGLWVDTLNNRVCLPEDKAHGIKLHIRSVLRAPSVEPRDLASLLGKLNFASRAAPVIRAHIADLHPLCTGRTRVVLDPHHRDALKLVKRHLVQWGSRGAPIWDQEPPVQVLSDASNTGWGFVIKQAGHTTAAHAGTWSAEQLRWHINVKELAVPAFALALCPERLRHRRVEFRLDNVAAVAALRRMYSPSLALRRLASRTIVRLYNQQVIPSFHHIRGVLNVQADSLSRQRSITVSDADPDSWMLHPQLFDMLNSRWGPHTADMFACPATAQLPCFFARDYHESAAGINALVADWALYNAYANPPFGLILPMLQHIRQCNASATVVVPMWPARPWWPLLRSMAVDYIQLPRSPMTFLRKGTTAGHATTWGILAVRVQAHPSATVQLPTGLPTFGTASLRGSTGF